MKVPPHIVRLYVKTARRYNKIVTKLQRETVSPYQRKTFLHKLRTLLRRLRDLQAQLKIAAATGTVTLALNVTTALAQEVPPASALGPFIKQDRINNPLREPIFNDSDPAIAVIDYDKDGDFDVVLGEYDYWYGARLRYLENQSAQGSPLYIEQFDEGNPFDGIRASTSAAAPAFADIDGDNDLDLFIGQNGWGSYYGQSDQGIEYYRNDDGVFTLETGQWNEATKEGNPLGGISLGQYVKPAFVDFDKDGDQDVIIGSYLWTGYPTYLTQHIHYYQNNGSGTFTSSPVTINQPISLWNSIAPAVSDLDDDGDYDIVLGSYNYGVMIYLKQVSPGSFDVEWEEWDPVAKTGNPFVNFELGSNASPVFIDFNQDGLLDLFVADEPGYYYASKYSDNIINYYENKGNNVFVEKFDFENPFGGVHVKDEAAPVLMDIDGDNDLDAVIGNKYYRSYYDYDLQDYVTLNSYLTLYKKEEDIFEKAVDEENPFDGLEVYGWFTPQFGDIDGDQDEDLISGDYWGDINFFRKDEDAWVHEVEMSPFAGLTYPYNGVSRLVDIDNDQDLDLFMTNSNGEIRYFENTGTATEPVFTEMFDGENPLSIAQSRTWSTAFLHFSDLDHDGDLDALFNGASEYDVESQAYLYFENTGSPEAPYFEEADESLFSEFDEDARLQLIDYDGDGDLDAFTGNRDGSVSYFKNQNPAVVTTLSEGVVQYENGADPLIIDPEIILNDEDNDYIAQATVTIENYLPGEILGFPEVDEITSVFDTSTGILTFRGKKTVGEYQALLRAVTFEVTYDAGRRVPAKKSIVGKTITFAVFDQDFTTPVMRSKSLEVFVNDPPAVGTRTIDIAAGGLANVDLKQVISDPNGSADLDLGSLKVIAEPGSGAVTSIDGNGTLTINYHNLTFLGTETLTLEVCDLSGACAQNTLTIIVSNTPPVIEPEPVSTPAGNIKSINLMNITSDVDGNLNPNAFVIVSQPVSGALASIETFSPTVVNLVLDYQNITFHGTDEMTIRACDVANACTESILQVDVDVDDAPGIVVYNAIAPNSAGDNKYMRITGLPEVHKVSIFNRWGDKVFDSDHYDNSTFKGMSNNGNSLPSGTYFYTIEVPGEKIITGYLTLKQ